MVNWSDTQTTLLFEHGFVKDKALASLTREERTKKLRNATDEERDALLATVQEEHLETADGYFQKTGYPESAGHLRLVWDSPNQSIEENYFWVLEHIRQDRGFTNVIKITDLYAASESSAFWGNQQQRISAQQNQAQGLLANVGKFVKDVFPMVRELRIIDERLEMYRDWHKKDPKTGAITTSDSADVTLKSLFTDQVEGGTKNPQSVFGLAHSVGFTILPDLFFNVKVYNTKDLDKKMQELDVNEQVKNVLRRKLYQFIVWKEHTEKELETRRTFNVRYLQQHWTIIETYMNWAKPYLRNLQKLQMRQDLDQNPDMVSSFDQSLAEVEFLAVHQAIEGVYPVVIVNFEFRTRPDMSIRREYQQGPSHMGRLDMNFRSFAWTKTQIDNYVAMRRAEDIRLLGMLDASLEHTMAALGDDIEKYLGPLVKAEDAKLEKPAKREKAADRVKTGLNETFEPFIAVFGGFAELFGAFLPSMPRKKTAQGPTGFGAAGGKATMEMFLTWHIFKKAKRMLTW